MNKPNLRERMLMVREEAIIVSVNRLLAERGYDNMTVDQVAADVGLSKAILYTHFRSKEELATAAMVAMLGRALEFTQSAEVARLPAVADKLRAVVRWCLKTQLAGQMPSLPAQNSSLREYLAHDAAFTKHLLTLSDTLGQWIEQAQAEGTLNPALPGELILFTLYARACDQVLQVMKAAGQYDDETLCDLIVLSCFSGLDHGTVPNEKLAKPSKPVIPAKPALPRAAAKKPAIPAPAHAAAQALPERPARQRQPTAPRG
jgi:TetR/AcrR family transcriptional regulator, regulator of autoinduction and epiphytic fitness